MSNPALPHGLDRRIPAPAPLNARERREKFSSRENPHNPLISLDSDERIQGNPRKSNPHKRGFSQRNGEAPRKPKRVDRTTVEKEPTESIRPNSKRLRAAHRSRGIGRFSRPRKSVAVVSIRATELRLVPLMTDCADGGLRPDGRSPHFSAGRSGAPSCTRDKATFAALPAEELAPSQARIPRSQCFCSVQTK